MRGLRMTEIELKFQVPAARREALARAVATATATRVRCARATSTPPIAAWPRPAWRCACARKGGAGCRRSRARGDGIWQRLEHEVPLRVRRRAAAGRPGAARRHPGRRGAAPGPGRRRAAADLRHRRRCAPQRLLRAPGCVVELAFDQGALTAGEQRWPLCELEFELKGGDAAALAGAGLALGRALRPDAGHAQQGRTRRPPGARRAPGRAGQGAAVGAAGAAWTATRAARAWSATA